MREWPTRRRGHRIVYDCRPVSVGLGFAIASLLGMGCDQAPGDPCEDFKGNPHADCDGDGLSNAYELRWGYDPAVPMSETLGVLDGDLDPDGDGLPNRTEALLGLDALNARSLDPDVHDGFLDSDDDGMCNMAEAWLGTPDTLMDYFTPTYDPSEPDTDVYRCDPYTGPKSFLMEAKAYRFTTMAIVEPRGLGGTLAGMLAADLSDGTLNIVAVVDAFENERCATYFRLAGGAALPHAPAQEGGNIMYTPHRISESVRAVGLHTSDDTAFFRTIEPMNIVFPRLFAPSSLEEGSDQFDLKLSHLHSTGTVKREASGLVAIEAQMRAVVTFDDAKASRVRVPGTENSVEVYQMLNSTRAQRYRPPGADEDIGFLVIANFRAEAVEYVSEPK